MITGDSGSYAVDESATEALRAEMDQARGGTKLFDFGFESIEELKARCEEETGLAPPAQPEFQKWVRIEQASVQMKRAS